MRFQTGLCVLIALLLQTVDGMFACCGSKSKKVKAKAKPEKKSNRGVKGFELFQCILLPNGGKFEDEATKKMCSVLSTNRELYPIINKEVHLALQSGEEKWRAAAVFLTQLATKAKVQELSGLADFIRIICSQMPRFYEQFSPFAHSEETADLSNLLEKLKEVKLDPSKPYKIFERDVDETKILCRANLIERLNQGDSEEKRDTIDPRV